MIDRYKACLAQATDRPFLLHALRDDQALTVRLLRRSPQDAPSSDADLTRHLPDTMRVHSFADHIAGEALGRPGTVWELTAGLTFAVPALGRLRPRECWVLGIDLRDQFVQPFERFSLTESTRQSRGVLLKMLNVRQVAMIASAFGAETLDDCQILLTGGAEGCVANFPFTHVFEPVSGREVTPTRAPDYFPRAVIAGPAAVGPGRMARFSLSFVDTATGAVVSNGERAVPVRLEATSGYLVDRVVYPRNGVARFRWKALGLSKGDRLKIKSSWGTWSGDHEIEVRVA